MEEPPTIGDNSKLREHSKGGKYEKCIVSNGYEHAHLEGFTVPFDLPDKLSCITSIGEGGCGVSCIKYAAT